MSYTTIRPATREEWLEERKKGVGSSDAGILMGSSKYGSPYKLWLQKTGRVPGSGENESMWLGHLLEPKVAEAFAEKTGAVIIPSSEGDWIARDDARPFLQVSPDRLYYEKGAAQTPGNICILECKTRGTNTTPDDYPDYWYTQVQYQMGVLGVRKCCIAWLCVQGYSFHFDFVEVPFNESYFDLLSATIEEFWNTNILGDVPPAFDAEEAGVAFPLAKAGSVLTADETLLSLVGKLSAVRQQSSSSGEERTSLENEIKMLMGESETLVDADGKVLVTWKNQKSRKVFDADSFRNENPDIYDRYLVQTEPARRFALK